MRLYIILIFAFCHSLLILPTYVAAADITVTASKTNTTVTYRISANEINLLAGIKITINFSPETLSYISHKTLASLNNFMNVINDKIPGKLILVAASAQGVSGKLLNLFELEFNTVNPNHNTSESFKLVECEMMDENLKSIPVNNLFYLEE